MHHFGDPCLHCDIPHDDVPAGPCSGDPKKAVPIAWCSLGVRWDGYENFRLLMSDGRVEERIAHISAHAPYYHFGRSGALTTPLPYDQRLKVTP